jgi:hypothetical protein
MTESDMPKRSSNPDLNQLAAAIVAHTTNGNGHSASGNGSNGDMMTKNPAAVALGRLGGLKGGKARAEKLTPEKRRAIAQKAAASRWKKNGSSSTTE